VTGQSHFLLFKHSLIEASVIALEVKQSHHSEGIASLAMTVVHRFEAFRHAVSPQLLVDDYYIVMLEASFYDQALCWIEKRFLQNDIFSTRNLRHPRFAGNFTCGNGGKILFFN